MEEVHFISGLDGAEAKSLAGRYLVRISVLEGRKCFI